MNEFVLSIMLILAITGIVAFCVYAVWPKSKISKAMMINMAVSLAVFGMCVNPDPYWDLYRHYNSISEIKSSGIGLVNFLFNNKLRIGGADYTSLVSFNLIRYFIAQTSEERLLPFVMILITYLLFMQITCDWYKDHDVSNVTFLIGIIMCFTFMPYVFVNSGLRNTTASAFSAYAIYRSVYRKKSNVTTIFMFVVAATIHPASLITAVAWVLYRIRNKVFYILIIFAYSSLAPFVLNIAKNTDVDLFVKMASLYEIYINKKFTIFASPYTYADYLLLLYCVPTLWKKRNFFQSKCPSTEFELVNWLQLYTLICISGIGRAEFVQRPAYVLGMLAIPLATFLTGGRKNSGLRITMTEFRTLVIAAISLLFVLYKTIPEYLLSSYL